MELAKRYDPSTTESKWYLFLDHNNGVGSVYRLIFWQVVKLLMRKGEVSGGCGTVQKWFCCLQVESQLFVKLCCTV